MSKLVCVLIALLVTGSMCYSQAQYDFCVNNRHNLNKMTHGFSFARLCATILAAKERLGIVRPFISKQVLKSKVLGLFRSLAKDRIAKAMQKAKELAQKAKSGTSQEGQVRSQEDLGECQGQESC